MDLDFGNTVLPTWYDGWIVVLGFVVSIVLAVLVVSRANWQTNGLLIKTAMVVTALVVMPLALAKIGLEIGIDEDNPDPIGYITLLAFIASVAVGASYLYLTYRQERQGAEPAYQEIVTPEDGTPLPPADDDATRTLTAGGTLVESPPIGGVAAPWSHRPHAGSRSMGTFQVQSKDGAIHLAESGRDLYWTRRRKRCGGG